MNCGRKSTIWPVLALLLIGGRGFSTLAQADDDDLQPAIKTPKFPKEPNKKAAEPVDSKTYVEGASEAPTTGEDLIPRVKFRSDQWVNALALRWFYANETQDHAFNATQSAHVTGSSVLSLGLRADFRAPFAPVSFVLRGAITSGTMNARPNTEALAMASYTSNTDQGFGGLRIHLLPRGGSSDLRLGADGGWTRSAYTTLEPVTGLDSQDRSQYQLLPCVEFRYYAGNWDFTLALRYGVLLGTSAADGGDLSTSGYRRAEGALGISRYVSRGVALGLGLEYLNERATWSETAPLAINDFSVIQDLRLNVFIRFEY